ncbi:MAG: hypothetical protein V7L00_20495 [Nostoc sp.]|uniref:hypothetical protein n=1 Tax=Nostoc sp. TaxID=1180 RepID=UPI002FF89531
MHDSNTEEIETATELLTKEVMNFLAYIRSVDPQLQKHEAIAVATIILSQLPRNFKENPRMLAQLKAECEAIKKLLRQ